MKWRIATEPVGENWHARVDYNGVNCGTLILPKYAADELARALGRAADPLELRREQWIARERDALLTRAQAASARDLLAARGWRRAALRLVKLARAVLGVRGDFEWQPPTVTRESVGLPPEAPVVLVHPGPPDVWRMLGPRKTEAERIEAEDEERWTEVLGP